MLTPSGVNINPDKFIKFTMNNAKKFGFKNYAVLIVMMLCSVVGVGFVSGAEIYRFFTRFGSYAYFGVVVFFVLIYFLTLKILKSDKVTQKNSNAEISHNQKYLKMINLSKFNSKNAFLSKSGLKSILTNLNVFMLSSAMFAGLFVVLKNLFNHNYFLIGILFLIGLFLLVMFGVSVLQKFDYFVAMLIGFVVVYFLIFSAGNCSGGFVEALLNFEPEFANFSQNETESSLKNFGFSILFSCIYVFMNIIQVQSIVSQYASQYETQYRGQFEGQVETAVSVKTCKKIAFWFAFLLSAILFVFVNFLLNNSYLANSEMPFFKFFQHRGGVVFVLFVLGLVLALMASLATTLLGVKKQIQHFTKSNFLATAVALVLVGLASLIGFSNFVFYVYPIIGILNLIIFVFL